MIGRIYLNVAKSIHYSNFHFRQMDLRVAMLLLSCVVPVFSKTVDYYSILGVQRHADETEIRSAFKSLAKIWHPDKMDEIESWGGSERFIAIREAYEVLSNSATREIYNRNNPEAGIYISWWGALLSACDQLTISLRQSELQKRIAVKSKDFLLQYELFTCLSVLCLISKYLSRVRVVQGLFFFGNLTIFPGLLAIYILLLAWRKNAFVVAFALAFGETVVYRTFISPTLSYIWHDVDEFVKVHQTDIFIYIVLATIVSFPVFLKYRTRCQLFPFCICAMSHIAVCTMAFKVMTFSDAVSFFVCLTLLAFLIDKVSTTLAVLIYLLVQITSGMYIESSPELFALTISVMIICWPLSCFYKDSRKWSLRRWISARFPRRKAGANTQQNQTAEKEENDIFFTNELNFYFTLTAVCLSIMFIYEFY